MTYISRSSDFSSLIFCFGKHFSFIGKAQFRQATLSCDSSYFANGDKNCRVGPKKYRRVGQVTGNTGIFFF